MSEERWRREFANKIRRPEDEANSAGSACETML